MRATRDTQALIKLYRACGHVAHNVRRLTTESPCGRVGGREMNPRSNNLSSSRRPLRLAVAAAAGGLAGAAIGAGAAGYMQLLQELSEFNTRAEFVAVAAIAGGLAGACVGAAVGLVTGLIQVARNRPSAAVRLR
jgi:hypothetical protein